MVPVVLVILVVVLISGAVLWIVGEQTKPTSAHGGDPTTVEPEPEPVVEPVAEPVPAPAPAAPPRRPATSRRRPPPPLPAPAPLQRAEPAAVAMPSRPAMVTARMSGAPLPRHRWRSGFLMVLLVAFVGVLVAVVVAVVIAALAFGLRAAVTS